MSQKNASLHGAPNGRGKASSKKGMPAVFLPYLILVIVVLVAALAFVFALRGCKNAGSEEQQTPASAHRGYYSSEQTVSGGESLNDVAIYDVNVEQKGDDLVISMQFFYTSESTEGNTTLTNLVPNYTIGILPQPYRLSINFEGMTQWTFTGKTSWLDYDLLQGAFVAPPTYESADNPTAVFHLASDVAYKVEEDDGTLLVYLKAVDTPLIGQYYVLLNGISQYAASKEVRELALTPTLCSDAVHTLLISRGFESEEEAQTFLSSMEDAVKNYMPGKQAFIEYLEPDALPTYGENLESEEIAEMPVIYRDGHAQSAEALEVNANALCISPNGDLILCFSPVYTLDMTSGETVYSEILYLSNETDQYEKLIETAFSMILSAQFSPDGHAIAFLDYNNNDNLTTLYYFNRDTKNLIRFSEEDFGAFIYDFVFDVSGNILYAVTLETNGGVCIRQYDLATDESKILFPLNASVGMLGVDENALYFTDTESDDEESSIYRLDKKTNEKTRIASGARFLISPDGRYLAAGANAGLYVIELASGNVCAQLPDVHLSDFHFAPNGQDMLCVVASDAPKDDSYPSDVYLFRASDRDFTYLFSTNCVDILWSVRENNVLLNANYDTQDGYIPIVYRAAY